MKTPSRLAVIPARGGSKRLPGKNIAAIGGRPMIEWTIRAALECRLFDRIVVSTDDRAIADIARAAGADVPFLRDDYADDHAPVSLATIDAVDRVQHGVPSYDVVVQLMANCPLRKAAHIIDAVAAFDAGGAAFQLSCFKFGFMNPWWAFKRRTDGTADVLFPEAMTRRSQDLDPLFCPSGAIWIARTGDLRAARTFHGNGATFLPLPWQAALDIDDEDDLALARALFEAGL